VVAAQAPTVQDKQIRVGLPSGSAGAGRMRQGAWAPVYIPLTAGPDGNAQQQFKLVLDAVDLEDNPYRYTVPVPALAPGVNEVVIGYLRAPNQEFTVTLETADGQTVRVPVKHQRPPEAEPLKPIYLLYVVAGGSTLKELKGVLKPDAPKPGEVVDEISVTLDKGYARIDKVADLPDRWFGYEAADVVILTTGNDNFMNDLNASWAATRRKALAEWVRRGGKLVLSVGRNHQFANSLLSSMPLPEVDKMPLLPFTITGSVQRPALRNVGWWANSGAPPLGEGARGVEVATLARAEERAKERGLGDGTHVLLIETEEKRPGKDPEQWPLIVSSSCGLGQVILVAFDLDGPPFNDWKGQKDFFVRLRDEISPKHFNPDRLKKLESNFEGRDQPELLETLQRQVDTFDDVATISFGWVALFILLYILVVGPLDYLVLKKVFKRLELTWVTFPTVVLTISVGAYFIAYALKGDDLRVNKVDLVEIDLHTPQAYGTSWFSVFSPRVQNYTLGVEPTLGPKPSTTVALIENVLATPRGSASIFRQPYEYAEDAAGIRNVPIPIWSTRSFAASWRTPLPADKLPIRADLVWRDGGVTGKITNNLPVDLEEVNLSYRGKWYQLPGGRKLVSGGDFFDVANLKMGGGGASLPYDQWTKDATLSDKRAPAPGSRRGDWKGSPPPVFGQTKTMKSLMFYSENEPPTNALNSGLRTLNQFWRLEPKPTDYLPEKGAPYREEVILVARVAAPDLKESGQEVNDKSLVRLWNDKLPGSADKCPPLAGFLSQETYVRVYIPVKNP
jgi:hypothetical protein